MSSQNFSFFVLDDEINIKDGPVSIVIDHKTLMSIESLDDWSNLTLNEKNFAVWYQDQILIKGLLPGPHFIVDSSIVDNYNQDALCAQIMNMLNIQTLEDPDFF